MAASLVTNGVLASIFYTSEFAAVDWKEFVQFAAEIEPVWAAMRATDWDTFDQVGLPQGLPKPAGPCNSSHIAARDVFEDMRTHVQPVLRELGLLHAGETLSAALGRLNERAPDLVRQAVERLKAWCDGSSVAVTWKGWRRIEHVLVAEIAGAADRGLVLRDDGGRLDQAQFATAVSAALELLKVEARSDLLRRWREVLPCVRALGRRVDEMVPSLSGATPTIDALHKLSAEVVKEAQDSNRTTPGVLELIPILDELNALAAHERSCIRERRWPLLNERQIAEVRSTLNRLPTSLDRAEADVLQFILALAATPPRAPGSAQQASPDVRWVPASTCIDGERKDATAVRRFCEQHGVPTRSPSKNRLLVDSERYNAVTRAIVRSGKMELDAIAERSEAEARRKRRAEGRTD